MQIRVDDLKDAPIDLEFSEKFDHFPALKELVENGMTEFIAPVVTRGKAFSASGFIEVEGTVEAGIRVSCSRCLQPYEIALREDLALTYTREMPEVEADDDDDGAELSAADMGLVLFEGEEIDLVEAVQEELVMAMPLRPLCDEGCRGLCPQCGADLNKSACQCEKPVFHSGFEALQSFKIDKDQKKD